MVIAIFSGLILLKRYYRKNIGVYMKKRIVILIGALLFMSLNTFGKLNDFEKFSIGKKYEVSIPNRVNRNYFNVNLYLFIHYFSNRILQPLKLGRELSINDKVDIFKKVLFNVYPGNNITIKVSNYSEGKPLIVAVKAYYPEKKNRWSFLFLTNYILKSQRLAKSEADLGSTYANLYFIYKDKLVKYQNVYSKEKELMLRSKKSLVNLADFYLFDEKIDNDAKAFSLLKKISKSGKPGSKFYATLTLVQYFLIKGNVREAERQLKQAKKILDDGKYKKGESHLVIYSFAEEELKIYKIMSQGMKK